MDHVFTSNIKFGGAANVNRSIIFQEQIKKTQYKWNTSTLINNAKTKEKQAYKSKYTILS